MRFPLVTRASSWSSGRVMRVALLAGLTWFSAAQGQEAPSAGPVSAPGTVQPGLSEGAAARTAPGRLARIGSAGPVGLARLLEATVSVHPSVRAKQGELQAAGFDLDGANWGWFPTVSSEVQADDGSRAAAVQVQQPLWTGGRIPGQIDLATANREAASAAVIEAEQQVMLSVGTSFYEFLRQQARIEIARSNEAEHSKLLEMIRRRVRAEVSPQSD